MLSIQTEENSALSARTKVPEMEQRTFSRRAFLSGITLLLSGGAGPIPGASASPVVRFGLFTDVHYADKPELRTRYYRESLTKLREGVTALRKSRVDFLLCLGDLVDAAAELELERTWVAETVNVIRETGIPAHFVLGNHCVQTLTKRQFLSEVGQERSHYSFTRSGVHFVILDACYRKDGLSYDAGNFDWKDTEIPPAEREWLKKDLAGAAGPAVVFVHQRLDSDDVHAVASAPEVRQILEDSGNVSAVFQGHSHQNDYRDINGIHYCTMRAVIEGSGAANNGYAEIAIFNDGGVKVEGFRAQRSYRIQPAAV
jgi:alkaline phosphatase